MSELPALVEARRRLRLATPARRRLLRELADHYEDAVRDGVALGLDAPAAEERAAERLGSADEIVSAWRARLAGRTRARRRRAALLVAASGCAAVLAVSARADGHRSQPPAPCPAAHAAPSCVPR